MAQTMPHDDADGDLGAHISSMSVDQLLTLWEQSQKICFALQRALPSIDTVNTVNDERIALELLRRAVQAERRAGVLRTAESRGLAGRR